jgi:hypothetical protein
MHEVPKEQTDDAFEHAKCSEKQSKKTKQFGEIVQAQGQNAASQGELIQELACKPC